jgi:ribose transport system substrate-binding protein
MWSKEWARRVASMMVIALFATGVAACGDDEDEGGGGGGVQAESGQLEAFDQKVDQLVEDGSKPQERKPPAEGPAPETGSSLQLISCDQRAEGCRRVISATEKAAKDAGWSTSLLNAESNPARMQAGLRRAMDTNADGIAVTSIDTAFMPDVLERVKSADIPIVCWVCGNDPEIYDQHAVITDPATYVDDGYLLAAAAYKLADRKLHLLMMEEKDFAVVRDRGIGTRKFVDECKAAGGDCKILGSAEFGLADITTSAPQKATNLARQHPDANVFWSAYDAAAAFQWQAIEQANAQGQMFGVSFDANEANLDIIREDGFQKLTIGQPATWVGYAFVDNLNRKMQGQDMVDQGVRTKLLNKDNVPESGPWEGDSDVARVYQELWGK